MRPKIRLTGDRTRDLELLLRSLNRLFVARYLIMCAMSQKYWVENWPTTLRTIISPPCNTPATLGLTVVTPVSPPKIID
jgi:hypothetical protein